MICYGSNSSNTEKKTGAPRFSGKAQPEKQLQWVEDKKCSLSFPQLELKWENSGKSWLHKAENWINLVHYVSKNKDKASAPLFSM